MLDFREHNIQPGERELAGLIDHVKAWTTTRQKLVVDLLGVSWTERGATRDRLIGIRGSCAPRQSRHLGFPVGLHQPRSISSLGSLYTIRLYPPMRRSTSIQQASGLPATTTNGPQSEPCSDVPGAFKGVSDDSSNHRVGRIPLPSTGAYPKSARSLK